MCNSFCIVNNFPHSRIATTVISDYASD